MPLRKKKQDEERCVDVYSCLDEVASCLDRANHSLNPCLEGISKADMALKASKGDSDVQCVALVKRAELLLVAATNNYNLGNLPGDPQQYSLERCIADCERVLSDVSPDDVAGKQVRDTARFVSNNAQKLMKDMQYEEMRGKSYLKNKQHSSGTVFKRYDPAKTCFKSIYKINPYLLQDIVNCYKKAKTVCRVCYYRKQVQEPFYSNRQCKGCKKIAQPLIMIPASKMCENLAGNKIIPIPPPPKNRMSPCNRHKPFQMCHNREHQLCEDKASVGDNWFAHSIEELVIWTVQRHYECKFDKYIEQFHQSTEHPNLSLFDSAKDGCVYYYQSDGDTDDLFSDSYSEKTCDETDDSDPFEYYPENLTYDRVSSIPQNLLLNIIEKYKSVKEYCKWCYYRYNKQGIVSLNRQTNRAVCSVCGRDWESVNVIPSSELCWNFGDFEFLPIASWPMGKPNKDPFEYCQKKDHFRCFRVYIESEFWYPHSVEEIVIWTVEREKRCTFSQYIDSLGYISSSESISNSTQSTGPAPNSKITSPTSFNSEEKDTHASSSKTHLIGKPTTVANKPTLISNSFAESKRANFSPYENPNRAPPMSGNRSFAGFMPTVQFNHRPDAAINNSMMYMPPQRPMYPHPHGPPVLLSQGVPLCIPQSPVMNRPNLNRQAMPYPSANPQVIAMNPHFRPYFSMNSNYNNVFPAKGDFPYKNSNTTFNSSSTAHEDETRDGKGGVNPSVSTYKSNQIHATDNGTQNLNDSDVDANSSNNRGKIMVSGDQKNYIVSQSPSRSGLSSAGDSGDGSVGAQAVEVKSVSSVPILATRVEEVTPQIFKFSEINFKNLLDIPASLLKSIALCFKEKVVVCRKCFYGERTLSKQKERQSGKKLCSTGEHKWDKPIIVIPGCDICDNEPSFQKGEHVPIPPLPPVAVLKKCSNRNHHKCFTKSLEQDLWQAHSVEELVVWIVESEKDCSFEEYVKESRLDIDDKSHSTAPVYSPKFPEGPVLGDPIEYTEIRATRGSFHTKSRAVKKYHPKYVSFLVIKDIPLDLLVSVAECYRDMQLVCRICFFESKGTALVTMKEKTEKTTRCNCDHVPWRPIKVIPRSPLCASATKYIPLPPLPNHMKQSSTPFVACKKNDHKSCYVMSIGTNPWFPHTVEELVIWTVERETAQPFEDVYKRYLPQAQNPSLRELSRVADEATDPNSASDYSNTVENSSLKSPATKSYSDDETDLLDSSITPASAVDTTTTSDSSNEDIGLPADKESKDQSTILPPSDIYSQFMSLQPEFHNPFRANAFSMEADSHNGPNDLLGLNLSAVGGIPVLPPGFGEGASTPMVTPGDVIENFPALLSNGRDTTFEKNQNEEFYNSSTVWNTEPSSDNTWSRAVGGRRPIEHPVGSPKLSSYYKVSDQSYFSSDDFDDFVHQSQVDNDTFQPYTAIKDYSSVSSSGVITESRENGIGFEVREQAGVTSESRVQPRKWPEDTSKLIGTRGRKSKTKSSSRLEAERGTSRADTVISDGGLNWSSSAPGLPNRTNSFTSMNESSNTYGLGVGRVEDISSSVNGDDRDRNPTRASITAYAMAAIGQGRNHKINGEGFFPATSMPSTSHSHIDVQPTPESHAIYESSSSDEINNDVMDESFCCLLCYTAYNTASELASHSTSDIGHLELALLDSGADKIWQYPPPPPQKSSKASLNSTLCTNSSCRGPPYCRRPHSRKEFQEWENRWLHRQYRKKDGINRNTSPRMNAYGEGLPISASKVLQAVVSVPYKIMSNSYCWDISIKGQNWLNLYGVTVYSPSSWTFKITRIEETITPSVFHPHSSLWSAPFLHGHKLRQCLLLGSVELTVKAIPPSNGKDDTPSGKVTLDLGYKQCLFIELKETTEKDRDHASFATRRQWNLSSQSSSSSDDLGSLNIEGEDLTLQHVPIEDWGCSLTDDQPQITSTSPWK